MKNKELCEDCKKYTYKHICGDCDKKICNRCIQNDVCAWDYMCVECGNKQDLMTNCYGDILPEEYLPYKKYLKNIRTKAKELNKKVKFTEEELLYFHTNCKDFIERNFEENEFRQYNRWLAKNKI